MTEPASLSELEALVAARPNDVAAREAYATALELAGRLAEAAEQLHQASQLPDATAAVCVRSATLFLVLGNHDAALNAYRRGFALAPNDPAIAQVLTGPSNNADERARARAVVAQDLERNPHNMKGWLAMAGLGSGEDTFRASLQVLDTGIARSGDPALRLYRSLVYPKLPASRQELDDDRATSLALLDGLIAEQPACVENPMQTFNRTPIHLVWHHQNTKPIQAAYVQAHRAVVPSLNWEAPVRKTPSRKRPRVGIISRFWQPNHVVGRSLHALFNHETDIIEPVLLQTTPVPHARDPNTNIVGIPIHLARARETIAELDLDVLLYPELGLDALTYYLSYARLAPVQAALPGHGMTSGTTTIDYYLTGRHWEIPGDISGHYTERPIKLDFPPWYFIPEATVGDTSVRETLGLPPQAKIYLCLHSIYKYHPDIDGMIARVLALDPHAHVVILCNPEDPWWNVLWKRLNVLGENAKRIVGVPRLNRSRYVGLVQSADVVLDAPHHSCGVTAYETLYMGVPIVTLPSEFMRGRMTSGICELMGAPELIATSAEDYAQRAVRVANEPAERAKIKHRLLAEREAIVGTPARAAGLFTVLAQLSRNEVN